METKHTPAPWEISNLDSAETLFYIKCKSGSLGSVYNKAGEEGEANARLVAAAPELLAALKDLMSITKTQYGQMATYKYCQDVLKKATGHE